MRFGALDINTLLSAALNVGFAVGIFRLIVPKRFWGSASGRVGFLMLVLLLLSYEWYYGVQDFLFLQHAPNSPKYSEYGVSEGRWPPFSTIDIVYDPETKDIFIVD